MITFGVLCVGSIVLSWFDNTTELIPNHSDVLNSCFAIAGLIGLIFGFVAFKAKKGVSLWRRAMGTCAFAMMGLISAFMFCSYTTDIIEGWIDFPASKTVSLQSLLVISRAYQTHGKSSSSNIQTTPIWSNLDITSEDYRFMQTHRRPGDVGRDPDEISSHGYFCAKVTLQQAGGAVRVLHAGRQTLPKNTVIICPWNVPPNPADNGNSPSSPK